MRIVAETEMSVFADHPCAAGAAVASADAAASDAVATVGKPKGGSSACSR